MQNLSGKHVVVVGLGASGRCGLLAFAGARESGRGFERTSPDRASSCTSDNEPPRTSSS
jgi:hypothetical protein